MTDDRRLVQLYNEDEQQVINFIEYRRLHVQGRNYVLLQPEDDLDQLVPFRVETGEGGEDELFIYVVDRQELDALEDAWQKLHS